MSTSQRGAARERQVRDQLRAEGWVVYRGAASHGCADLVAMRAGEIRLVQVKGNKGSPWMNFRATERAALWAEALAAGGQAWLVHWPPRGQQRWIAPDEWPNKGDAK